MSVSSSTQMNQAFSSSQAVNQRVALRAALDKARLSPSSICGSRNRRDNGLDRLVHELKQCFNITTESPDETRPHQEYLVWKSVLVLEKFTKILDIEAELLDAENSNAKSFFDNLRSEGIL
jgi:hypothetical protein